MSIVVTPIPRLTAFAAPALTLGTANAAGVAPTTLATDSTLLAFDAVVPDAITFGQSGAVGAATVASRRDHAHAMAGVSGGAALVLIGTVTADDDASLTITGLSSTYGTYLITWSDMVPASADAWVFIRVGDSNGIDSGGSDYEYADQRIVTSATTYDLVVSTGASYMRAGNAAGDDAGEGVGGYCYLLRPGDGTVQPMIAGQSTGIRSEGMNASPFYGMRKAVITLDRVAIYFNAGNISTGRFSVWGLSHA